ncbi:MAG: MliC family protein [Gammaproteobacteria bacterium]|nr:MliC family protein [Gammaproteobacteria bacterium]MDH4314090.1 MliC family protein [Gammaproteobacteria bacterium]MDH5213133.1 MliC family protein [Gammaproteobacteria bacterium]MDH5499603.1 MliC family protein [Gammaproteobacteria bacterium]
MSRSIAICVSLASLLLVACAPGRTPPGEDQESRPDASIGNLTPHPVPENPSPADFAAATEPTFSPTSVFDCGDTAGGAFSFVIKAGPGEIAIWLPPRFGRPYLVLGQSASASGAKFEGDGITVWTHGDEALLKVDNQRFQGCRKNRARSIWEHAKLSGVDFRAAGNEPGWYLEIRNSDSLKFVYEYGQNELLAPAPAPIEDPASRQVTYAVQNDAYSLIVRIIGAPCIDSMSGDQFESHVVVDLDGKTYQGCGRALH